MLGISVTQTLRSGSVTHAHYKPLSPFKGTIGILYKSDHMAAAQTLELLAQTLGDTARVRPRRPGVGGRTVLYEQGGVVVNSSSAPEGAWADYEDSTAEWPESAFSRDIQLENTDTFPPAESSLEPNIVDAILRARQISETRLFPFLVTQGGEMYYCYDKAVMVQTRNRIDIVFVSEIPDVDKAVVQIPARELRTSTLPYRQWAKYSSPVTCLMTMLSMIMPVESSVYNINWIFHTRLTLSIEAEGRRPPSTEGRAVTVRVPIMRRGVYSTSAKVAMNKLVELVAASAYCIRYTPPLAEATPPPDFAKCAMILGTSGTLPPSYFPLGAEVQ